MEGKQAEKKAKFGNEFLTSREQIVCKQITKGKPPYSQQALTLLALHEGNTQLQASEESGLTPGQVKYLAAKFRLQRLNIFPGELLNELSITIDEPHTDPGTETSKLIKAEKKKLDSGKGKSKKNTGKKKKKDKTAKKDKKGKKEKKADKAKKASKDKKVKKDKKSKKKSK